MSLNPTKLTDFSGFIRPELAEAYFQEARRNSVIQQMARQVPLSGNGVAVPVTTSRPSAGWVAEGGKKPVTSAGVKLATMEPKKLACITVVSSEVVRANPAGFMENLTAEIGEAFGRALDSAAFHGTNSPFATNLAATSKSASVAKPSVWDGVNSALELLVTDDKNLTGFVFDAKCEPAFNQAVDSNGRPMFVDTPTTDTAAIVRDGRLLGRPAVIAKGIASEDDQTLGFAGDFSKILWGTVGGITYDVSTEATVDGVSLWQHNLVAIRAEAEFGLLIEDPESFVAFKAN